MADLISARILVESEFGSFSPYDVEGIGETVQEAVENACKALEKAADERNTSFGDWRHFLFL